MANNQANTKPQKNRPLKAQQGQKQAKSGKRVGLWFVEGRWVLHGGHCARTKQEYIHVCVNTTFTRAQLVLGTFQRPPAYLRNLHSNSDECGRPSPELWWMWKRFWWILAQKRSQKFKVMKFEYFESEFYVVDFLVAKNPDNFSPRK